MTKHSGSGRSGSAAQTNRAKKPASAQARRLAFESLEHRRLLSSVGLNAISNVTLPAGTSIMVALNGSDPTSGKTVNFGVTTSNPTKVTPILMPQTNKSVQFNIAGLGTMTFQLFDNLTPGIATQIETLANSTNHVYNGDYIYRSDAGFVVQGGNILPTITDGQVTGQTTVNQVPSSVPSTVNDEFNPDLTYASAGSLGLAIPSPNGGSSEFFIGEGGASVQDSLDYSYSLFGFMTVNQAITVNGQATTVFQALEADSSSSETASGSGGDLLTPIKITSATVFTDTQNGVLVLKAPTGAAGSSYTVTVTASDGTNTPTTRTFTVNVVSNTATSAVTNPWASKTPAAPTSIAFQPQSGQGTATMTSANNSTTSKELQFLVSGVTIGDQVTVYADGVAIGSNVATSATQVVSTNGTTTLFDGTHTFTATETASNQSATWTDSKRNSRTDTANVDSLSSPGVQLQVFTSLAVTSTPAASATVGVANTYTVQTNAPGGDAVTVTPGTLPTGMQFSATTQTFTWTPTSSQANTALAFSASVSDSLGNAASIGPVDISVAAVLSPVQIPANSSLGGNVTVSFSGSQVEVYDNIANVLLSKVTFKSTDTFTVDCPAGQANSVSVVLPNSASAPLPQEVLVQGLSGSTNNHVTVVGTAGANTFTLAGSTVTANGLKTMIATVQKLTLNGGGGNDYYTLNSGAVPTSIIDTGGYNTLDFSHDTAGVTVNLSLDKGQAQSITPWNTTLSISGVINKLIGTAYADVLTGGPAATTEIVGGLGNDK
ncbi:MAG: peptidylprolyl isomerase, partial [Thermoguttaceae bacterium]